MLGLVGKYLDSTGIEKTGQFQVKLHLKHPELAVPEHLFHYPAIVCNHKTFEGDFIKKPHGTGPYTLESFYRANAACSNGVTITGKGCGRSASSILGRNGIH